MFPNNEISDSKRILRYLEEIEELSINAERIIEIEATIANLKNSDAISGRGAIVNTEKNFRNVKIKWRNRDGEYSS